MIRRKNVLATTDSDVHATYKAQLDDFWGVHSHSRLVNCHAALVDAGASRARTIVEEVLFTDPFEADFFRAAMRMVRSQTQDEDPITYEKIQCLFRNHVQKVEQATVSTLTSA